MILLLEKNIKQLTKKRYRLLLLPSKQEQKQTAKKAEKIKTTT